MLRLSPPLINCRALFEFQSNSIENRVKEYEVTKLELTFLHVKLEKKRQTLKPESSMRFPISQKKYIESHFILLMNFFTKA